MDRVFVMGVIRLSVGVANVLAGLLMWRSESVKTSIAINGILGSVLPIVFMLIMAIGVTGLPSGVSPVKIGFIVAGTALIMLGTR
jgi:hypothetical protein